LTERRKVEQIKNDLDLEGKRSTSALVVKDGRARAEEPNGSVDRESRSVFVRSKRNRT